MLARRSALTPFLTCLLITGLFTFSSPLMAQTLKPGQAAAIAQQQYGGKVLKVSVTNMANDSKGYQVKLLLPSGHVTQVLVDGDSGRIGSAEKTSKKKNN